MFLFMTADKKQRCYPLCFFSDPPIKNNSVTPAYIIPTVSGIEPASPRCQGRTPNQLATSATYVTPYVFIYDRR